MLIDPQKVLEATNGGLDIILDYVPGAARAVQKKNHKFKLRNEKTASASLKQAPDGNWIVTDFGADSKPRNAIALVAFLEGWEWKQALHHLAAHYNVDAEIAQEHFQPGYQSQPAPEGKKEGYYYEYKEQISDEHRKIIGKFITQEVCDCYNLKGVKQYSYVKKDSKTGQLVEHIFSEKEHYPIFQFEMGTWRKRLEPKALKKDQRFRYDGDRPKDFLFGLDQCRQKLEEERKAIYDEKLTLYLGDELEEEMAKTKAFRFSEKHKLDHIIIGSGDRDSLSIVTLGYENVVWQNSETALLDHATYKELMTLTHELYNLPDIDKTGLKQAHSLAMKYLDIRTIELPRKLRSHKDWRGNPRKDLRDWMDVYNTAGFHALVRDAHPYRFWDPVMKDGHTTKYTVNNVRLYNFLMKNGFYRIRLEKNKLGYVYIRIVGNVVKEVDPVDIKGFIHHFLEERRMPVMLRNTFYRSAQAMNENSFSHLRLIEIDFRSYTKNSQYLFFKNAVWEITRQGITEHKPGEVDRFVWEDEVIDHKVELTQAPFKVQYLEEEDQFLIESKTKCLFYRYLLNSSRMFWQDEEAEGKELPEHKRRIEQHHLVNKLFAFGYVLHRAKIRSKAWCVYAMDGAIADDISESHGGTGKSVGLNQFEHFMRTETVNARNPKIWDSQFMYENVNQYTGFVIFDDANQYFRFENLYSEITGKWKINPKHGRQFTLSFEESPKLGISTNFGSMDMSSSTARRLLPIVYSDYYHDNSDGRYESTRTIADDLGKNLFMDFDDKEWNAYFNTIAWACHLYFNYEKIMPSMESVRERTLRNIMTDSFKNWADVYFSNDKGTDRLNRNVPRPDAFEDFKRETNKRNMTSQRWMKSLQAYCSYKNLELNPKEEWTSGNRIIDKVEAGPGQPKKTVEMVHLRTPGYDPSKKPKEVKRLHDDSFLKQDEQEDDELQNF